MIDYVTVLFIGGSREGKRRIMKDEDGSIPLHWTVGDETYCLQKITVHGTESQKLLLDKEVPVFTIEGMKPPEIWERIWRRFDDS